MGRAHDAMDMRFEDFFEAAKDPVFKVVLLSVRDRDLAEEATAEAFVRACARWRKLRTHPNPAGWTVRTALNYQRSHWRKRQIAFPALSVVDSPSEPIEPLILVAIRNLPRRQREVVALRFLLDQSTDQTADILGISPGTVTTHVHRALGALRDTLPARLTEEV